MVEAGKERALWCQRCKADSQLALAPWGVEGAARHGLSPGFVETRGNSALRMKRRRMCGCSWDVTNEQTFLSAQIFFFFSGEDRISLYNPDCPRTH